MKLIICLLVIFHNSQSLVYGPKIQIPQGELRGTIEVSLLGGLFLAFKGIPYATPPVGKLRFSDPLPAAPWNGILNATHDGDTCRFLRSEGSEDCLYLNVYTPPDLDPFCSPLKSVMVWNLGDAGTDGSRNPDFLVAKDVIVVLFNHRVGLFGFLNLNDEVAPGNQGLKDQVLVLKWVKDNIVHFGGNPDSVTIAGVGLGAAYVHYLALSSMADGLYHKVIAQSGTALNPWAHPPYCQRDHIEELAAAVGTSTKDPKKLVEILRMINDPEELSQLYVKLATAISAKANDYYPSLPSVDKKSKNPFFPTPVNWAAQKGVGVPFLLGDVTVEGMYYLSMMQENTWIKYNSDLRKALSPGVLSMLKRKGISVQKIREFYFCDKEISPATSEIYARMQSDLEYTYGIHDTVAIQVSKQSPTYMYRFSYDSGHSYMKHVGVNIPGVSHLEDLDFFFYRVLDRWSENPPPGATMPFLVDRVTQMWTDFAKTGDPTPNLATFDPSKWERVQDADIFNIMDISEYPEMKTLENINNRILNDMQERNTDFC